MILYKDSTILAKIFEKQGGGRTFTLINSRARRRRRRCRSAALVLACVVDGCCCAGLCSRRSRRGGGCGGAAADVDVLGMVASRERHGDVLGSRRSRCAGCCTHSGRLAHVPPPAVAGGGNSRRASGACQRRPTPAHAASACSGAQARPATHLTARRANLGLRGPRLAALHPSQNQ